ncbi:hypothetical protein AYI68_g3422 [Smittium mucronatum]|uniref:Uncharacterized protein n=1 Tax=Smittium mucronatum TaxID=133383 RepID=A0A1R0GZY5_9FUNG|nr:hypothetical protein AYI68_g3422 [Smittium mucronatum]
MEGPGLSFLIIVPTPPSPQTNSHHSCALIYYLYIPHHYQINLLIKPPFHLHLHLHPKKAFDQKMPEIAYKLLSHIHHIQAISMQKSKSQQCTPPSPPASFVVVVSRNTNMPHPPLSLVLIRSLPPQRIIK